MKHDRTPHHRLIEVPLDKKVGLEELQTTGETGLQVPQRRHLHPVADAPDGRTHVVPALQQPLHKMTADKPTASRHQDGRFSCASVAVSHRYSRLVRSVLVRFARRNSTHVEKEPPRDALVSLRSPLSMIPECLK
jgi:hypothetical protein